MGKIKVSVLMLAYNHEEYIRDAINGVLMQKTNFDFELIVHDDASTDKTAEIIKEYELQYPDIVKPIYQKENQYSKGVRPMIDVMPMFIRGEYVALCEGDDYWINELKLQKQIDYLDNNRNISLCIHNAWRYDASLDSKVLLDSFPSSGVYGLKDQILAGLGTKFPATASYVFRKRDFDRLPIEWFKGAVGDYPIRVYLASVGDVYYFHEAMSVYRYSSIGSFTKKIQDDPYEYAKYISEISKLYNLINEYTKYEFDNIYKRKIKSDYIGLATSIIINNISLKDIDNLELDMKILTQYIETLNVNSINSDMISFVETSENCYLYGTSKLAELILYKLEKNGMSVKGFVVSDGYTKPKTYLGKNVFYLSEVEKYNNLKIILSVQPINEVQIIKNLKKRNIQIYTLW